MESDEDHSGRVEDAPVIPPAQFGGESPLREKVVPKNGAQVKGNAQDTKGKGKMDRNPVKEKENTAKNSSKSLGASSARMRMTDLGGAPPKPTARVAPLVNKKTSVMGSRGGGGGARKGGDEDEDEA